MYAIRSYYATSSSGSALIPAARARPPPVANCRHKSSAPVGELRHDGIEIIGIGSHPSDGLRKGVVVNIEKTVNSIKEVV